MTTFTCRRCIIGRSRMLYVERRTAVSRTGVKLNLDRIQWPPLYYNFYYSPPHIIAREKAPDMSPHISEFGHTKRNAFWKKLLLEHRYIIQHWITSAVTNFPPLISFALRILNYLDLDVHYTDLHLNAPMHLHCVALQHWALQGTELPSSNLAPRHTSTLPYRGAMPIYPQVFAISNRHTKSIAIKRQ
jgi:hypothetical protein